MPPVKVEILTIEVSMIRRTLIMIKVNKSIRDLFTKNAEPDFRFTSGFVFPDNLIHPIQVLMNISFGENGKFQVTLDEP